MIRSILRAVILGPPGSGKGTISSRIVKDFGLTHLSSGDILRSHVARATATGLLAKSYIDEGGLVPDKVMVDLIFAELSACTTPGGAATKAGWLLDGFPRTVAQGRALLKLQDIDIVVNMDVPFDEIINRVRGRYVHAPSGRIYHTEFNPPRRPGLDDVTGEPLVQREDDRESTVRARLDTYRTNTEPLLGFFKEKKLLSNFPGRFSNEIWPKVHADLSRLKTPLQYTEYK